MSTSEKPRPEFLSFAHELRDAMLAKGFSASDLARLVWDTIPGRRGARNRDRIRHYLAGTSYPTPDNLKKLGQALGVAFGARPQASSRSPPPPLSHDVQITLLNNRPGVALIQMKQLVTVKTALAIASLIEEDRAKCRSQPTPKIARNGS
jgi:transcriptional regulator with XRE-family HTH domain